MSGPLDEFHIPEEVLVNVIRVFLLGTPWKIVKGGDIIREPYYSKVWCRWRDVQRLRSRIISQMEQSDITKSLAKELREVISIANKAGKSMDNG